MKTAKQSKAKIFLSFFLLFKKEKKKYSNKGGRREYAGEYNVLFPGLIVNGWREFEMCCFYFQPEIVC